MKREKFPAAQQQVDWPSSFRDASAIHLSSPPDVTPTRMSALRARPGAGKRTSRLPARIRLSRTCAMACRSEEHTSELQSQSNLVCRLLLEKKKKTKHTTQCQVIA